MKKILFFLSIAVLSIVVLTACNSNNRAEADAVARLKAYQDSVKLNADTAGLAQFQAWKAEHELTDAEMAGENTPYATASNNVSRSTAPARRYSSATRSSGSRSSSSGNTASAPARKKISKAAKGAVIGGVGGAVAGAVINKRNRVVGGVVGGILGAGVGYGIGRSQDKKDGRY